VGVEEGAEVVKLYIRFQSPTGKASTLGSAARPESAAMTEKRILIEYEKTDETS
jgi:hypothetical protein